MKSILCFFFCFCLLADFSQAQNYRDTLNQKLEQIVSKSKIPGVGVALVGQDGLLYKNGFGYSDLETQTPYTTQNIQNIGSISKTLISFVLMKFVEEGKLRLDDPINLYLPFEVRHAKNKGKLITIRHLATHTSGLTDGKGNMVIEKAYLLSQKTTFKDSEYPADYAKYYKIYNQNQDMSMKDFLYNCYHPKGKWFKRSNFGSAPGKKYRYSNIGAALLAYILEEISGKTFDELTQDYLLNPLNMEETGWFFKDVKMENFSSLYLSNGLKIPNYELITYPDGGLITSIDDFCIYLQEMIRGINGNSALLKKEHFVEMMSNQLTEANFPKGKFKKLRGFNWDVNSSGDNIGMNGADPGILSYCLFTTAGNMGLVIFMNCSFEGDKEMNADFFKIRNTLLEYSSKLLKE